MRDDFVQVRYVICVNLNKLEQASSEVLRTSTVVQRDHVALSCTGTDAYSIAHSDEIQIAIQIAIAVEWRSKTHICGTALASYGVP